MTVTRKDRAVKTSAWILYTFIVLEILFMVSPFAAYYYSIYAAPLNLLQTSQTTAWLTMYVLPHYTYTDSRLAAGLVMLAWPLMFLGITIFIVGFCQIYWAKITGKGAVAVGLYKHIRHPQYIALAVIGLGACLYWSRLIVIVAFVSMLCLYYFLARVEERICLEKFGESYRGYLARTGMFLPRRWEAQWLALDWRLPEPRGRRIALGMGLYVLTIGITVALAFTLRQYVVDSFRTDVRNDRLIVYLAPLSPDSQKVVSALIDGMNLHDGLFYVGPASWRVPELGLERTITPPDGAKANELLHPTTHGNPLQFDESRVNVVRVEAKYPGDEPIGLQRLTSALDIRPIGFASLDLSQRAVLSIEQDVHGQWAGIPTPTF